MKPYWNESVLVGLISVASTKKLLNELLSGSERCAHSGIKQDKSPLVRSDNWGVGIDAGVGAAVGLGVTAGVGTAVGTVVGLGVTAGVGTAVGTVVGLGKTVGDGTVVGVCIGEGMDTLMIIGCDATGGVAVEAAVGAGVGVSDLVEAGGESVGNLSGKYPSQAMPSPSSSSRCGSKSGPPARS